MPLENGLYKIFHVRYFGGPFDFVLRPLGPFFAEEIAILPRNAKPPVWRVSVMEKDTDISLTVDDQSVIPFEGRILAGAPVSHVWHVERSDFSTDPPVEQNCLPQSKDDVHKAWRSPHHYIGEEATMVDLGPGGGTPFLFERIE